MSQHRYIWLGVILGALNEWDGLCAITFFIGFGLGGNIPIDATIVLEFLPNVIEYLVFAVMIADNNLTLQDRRYLLAALSVFQPVGEFICGDQNSSAITLHARLRCDHHVAPLLGPHSEVRMHARPPIMLQTRPWHPYLRRDVLHQVEQLRLEIRSIHYWWPLRFSVHRSVWSVHF